MEEVWGRGNKVHLMFDITDDITMATEGHLLRPFDMSEWDYHISVLVRPFIFFPWMNKENCI